MRNNKNSILLLVMFKNRNKNPGSPSTSFLVHDATSVIIKTSRVFYYLQFLTWNEICYVFEGTNKYFVIWNSTHNSCAQAIKMCLFFYGLMVLEQKPTTQWEDQDQDPDHELRQWYFVVFYRGGHQRQTCRVQLRLLKYLRWSILVRSSGTG